MINNFRDLGGIKNRHGQTVKYEIFFRSAILDKADAKDAEMLKSLGVKTIIDLRAANELETRPEAELPGISRMEFSLVGRTNVGINKGSSVNLYEKLMAVPPEERKALVPRMENIYKSMLALEAPRKAYKELMLMLISDRQGGILFHCTSGKDRTGMVAAGIYTLLGVDREEILKEYMKSYAFSLTEMKPLFLKNLERFNGDRQLAALVSNILIADPEYLKAFFGEMDERFGGEEGFAFDYLGLSEAELSDFRNRLLI